MLTVAFVTIFITKVLLIIFENMTVRKKSKNH